jgi:hypothetical protein
LLKIGALDFGILLEFNQIDKWEATFQWMTWICQGFVIAFYDGENLVIDVG